MLFRIFAPALTFSALLSSTGSSHAQAPTLDPAPYDTSGDGKLSLAERDVYLLHSTNETFKTLDTNKDGAISSEEAAVLIKDANESAAQTIAIQRSFVNSTAQDKGIDPEEPMTSAVFSDLIGLKPARPTYIPTWFRMRGKVSDFENPPGPLDKVAPAIFSYGKEYENGDDTWTGIGAIGGLWNRDDYSLSVGAEFNRMDTNTEDKDNVDSLVFKAMGSGASGCQKGVFASTAWRAGVDYATNFDFDGSLLGVSVDFEPLWRTPLFTGIQPLFGVNTKHSTATSPTIALRNFIHAEGGGQLEDFPGTSVANNDYLRLGPQVEASFWPFGTDFPILLTSSYGYYFDLINGEADYHNFKAGVEWRLDQQGHFVFKVDYIDGLTPLLLQHQEALLISFGVRY
jgi:hypothetical protein